MKKIVLLLVGLYICLSGWTPGNAQTPRTPLEAGVCAFKNKNYTLAQAEFEKALEKDPKNGLLMLFAARAIDFQVDPKDTSPSNVAKARSAIEAYSKLLAAEPADDEAVQAIVRLYEQIDSAKLPEIAANESTAKPIRTAIYIKLAGVGNTCANDITYENKTEVNQRGSRSYRFHMPKDPKDLEKAKACASEGMKFIDQALTLDPNSESVWSYKASLSIQMSRLAEMQQLPVEKARFDKEALAAKAEFMKFSDAAKERQAQADRDEQERWKKERPTADSNLASMAKFIATGQLVKRVTIDKNSIDSRDITLLSPPDDPGRKQQPKPDLPSPPTIVWKTITHRDESFSLVLPSDFDLVRTMYLAKGEGISFLFTYIDLPANHPPATPDEIIGGTASAVADSICGFSLMANASCEVRLAKKTSLGPYPGIEYSVTEDDCIKVLPGLIRVFATPNRVYALAAIGGEETDPRVAKFLNSFTIKK